MSKIEYNTRVSAPLDTGADYFVLRYDLWYFGKATAVKYMLSLWNV